jgi:hypothetical protein
MIAGLLAVSFRAVMAQDTDVLRFPPGADAESAQPIPSLDTTGLGEGLAQRLGPQALDTNQAPRLIQVPLSTPVPGGAQVSPDGLTGGAGNAGRREASSSTDRWREQVDRPAMLRQLDTQIAVTEARVAAYQQRRMAAAGLNAFAPPDTRSFSPSNVVPPSENYSPQTMATPVQAFSPSSSFSHVLAAMDTHLQEAEAELAAYRAQRERLLAASPGNAAAPAPSLPSSPEFPAKVLQQAEADLRLARFRARSYEARLEQLDQMSQYTYNRYFTDIRDRLQLGRLQMERNVADLEGLQRSVQDFAQQEARAAAPKPRMVVVGP